MIWCHLHQLNSIKAAFAHRLHGAFRLILALSFWAGQMHRAWKGFLCFAFSHLSLFPETPAFLQRPVRRRKVEESTCKISQGSLSPRVLYLPSSVWFLSLMPSTVCFQAVHQADMVTQTQLYALCLSLGGFLSHESPEQHSVRCRCLANRSQAGVWILIIWVNSQLPLALAFFTGGVFYFS